MPCYLWKGVVQCGQPPQQPVEMQLGKAQCCQTSPTSALHTMFPVGSRWFNAVNTRCVGYVYTSSNTSNLLAPSPTTSSYTDATDFCGQTNLNFHETTLATSTPAQRFENGTYLYMCSYVFAAAVSSVQVCCLTSYTTTTLARATFFQLLKNLYLATTHINL